MGTPLHLPAPHQLLLTAAPALSIPLVADAMFLPR